MKKLVGLAISCCLMSVAATAGAGEWAQTFEEESLPEELFDVSVVVAVEGPQSERVGRVLVDSLDESGAGEARMNPALDRIGARSDEEVVAELARVPADVVVTVRTYSEEYITADEARELAEVGVDAEVSAGDEDSIPLGANLEADMGRMAVYAIDGTPLGKAAVIPGELVDKSERDAVGEEVKRRVIEAEEPLVHAEPLIDEVEEPPDDVEEDETAAEEAEEREEVDEEGIGAPEYEDRYAVEGSEDSLILRDRWDDRALRDAGMYEMLDDDWLAEFEANRSSYRRRMALSVLSVTAGGIAAGVGAHQWVEGHRREIPTWKRDICHRETVLERRQECVDAVHSDLYGTRIRGGQAAAVSGAVVLAVGIIGFSRTRGTPVHPVSKGDIVERVDEINEFEDWEALQRRRLEQRRREQRREEERRRREEQTPQEEETEERDGGGGLQVDRSWRRTPMKASSPGVGAVDIHPYLDLGEGVRGGIVVNLEW